MKRRHQVASLVADGLCNRDIARELNMAYRTVKAHCARLFLDFNIDKAVKDKRVRLATAIIGTRPAVESCPLAKPLTAKEWEIVKLIAEGLTNSQIAAVVGTTEDEIKNKLARYNSIYDKLGMSTRLEVAVWYASRYKATPREDSKGASLEDSCENCCPYF
jgi:DNA-binding NarL/FixJ family response regulator